jgi:hypothetical protein
MCSYERENYDLIRGAFLKYYYQLRLGDMDGLFLSYHNTQKTFGFEYIERSFVEKVIFGGNKEAELSYILGSKIASTIIEEIKSYF